MMRTLSALFRLMRPHQWLKNVFVFAGLAFGERVTSTGDLEHVLSIGDPADIIRSSIVAFVVFCAISGVVYIFNDLKDVEQDRLHPQKRNRPLAAGEVSPVFAALFGALVLVAGLALAYWLSTGLFWIATAYLVINVVYTVWWKHAVILDIFSVASGFVLRVLAGVVAVDAVIGPWIVICTLFLALLISLGKRRSEVALLGENAGNHRKILIDYPLPFLDLLIVSTAGMTVMTYALFTFESGRGVALMFTIPFVLYGVFRYLYLLYVAGSTLPPEALVVKDRALLFTGVLWVALTAALIVFA